MTRAIKTKGKAPIVVKEIACVIFYKSTEDRGWYVREYHSDYAMEQHLSGKPGWELSYSETGTFTKKEAKEYALEILIENYEDHR